ncbi:MAG: S-layer homology domain-containing protein, partial [Oscillibacter sp.]|nr:S-layer homology domain-containing protein [Oscillibacter sp.]
MGKLNRLKLLLTGLLVLLLSVTAASAFSDTQGHPSEAAINKWSTEYGLISGYGDGTFHPNDSITKGAFAAILDRMMHFRAKSPASTFRDTAGNQWEDAVLKLHANAIYISENGYAEPNAPVTRQQAVTMIARAFDFAADAILPRYADDYSIAGYAQGPVSKMAELGYLDGVADTYFRPNDPITRADVVRIFDNIMSVMVTTQAPLSRDVAGNVLVSSQGGATLRDMYITGDLYVAPGVISTVLLDNVTLGGETRNFSQAASVEYRSTAATPVLPEEEPEQRPPAQTAPAAPVATPDSGNTPFDSGET